MFIKYLRQISIILAFTFTGELLNRLIPVLIPASVYGMILLFLALRLKLVKLDAVRETGYFLIALMPVLFVAPLVNLLDVWGLIAPNLLPIAFVIILSTFLTFGVSGATTQAILQHREKREPHE